MPVVRVGDYSDLNFSGDASGCVCGFSVCSAAGTGAHAY